MMTDPCYPNGPQNIPPIYGASQQVMNPNSSSSTSTNQTSFLYNLSLLKEKVHEMQSLASIFSHHPESTPIVASTMGTLIQEIIVTASSMMFACQQMSLAAAPSPATAFEVDNKTTAATETLFVNPHGDDTWYGDVAMGRNGDYTTIELPVKTKEEAAEGERSYELIEVEAADLLAKYTHYCKVCGKGFKRDANLRMHMRAHGDEYKSSAALSNPAKNKGEETGTGTGTRKYSCPQEGCRWNKRHARFQPLKSMICVKNHYKRTHCPKMYVCKRCNAKHFSVLSDLRTHEKHCGDLKWLCSCGTTFSRKDKLIGHVSLFLGHTPATALT